MATAFPPGRDHPSSGLPEPVSGAGGLPFSSLAPMQDVTNLAFMRVIAKRGAPDYFFTEYFRAHPHSRLERHILASIDQNQTGRPVFAQLIGESPRDLGRAARELENHPIAGVDLNMGCPAPKVYKKNAGGGLLRHVAKVDEILGALRETVTGRFTVKMRIGFEDAANFHAILDLINKHRVDLLSIHGRTVKQGYLGEVDYDRIAEAVAAVDCPVQANGNLTSARKAMSVWKTTGCHGLMVGRAAIRNPWIFRQIRETASAKPVHRPTMADMRDYVDDLHHATRSDTVGEEAHVNRMKKFLNFVGQGVDPEGKFLHAMRRSRSEAELFTICDRFFLADPERLFPEEPFEGLIARPNREAPALTDNGCRL